MLRGVSTPDIARQLRREGYAVQDRTVRGDVLKVKADMMEQVISSRLRSLKLAYAERMEIWTELWRIFDRPPRMIPTATGTIEEDRSFRQIAVLTRLLAVSESMDRITGIGSPKFLEQLTWIEKEPVQGLQITRLTIDEELEERERKLLADEALALSKGLTKEDLNHQRAE